MTLQPKFDLNVHVTQRERERERENTPGQKVENKFHAKQRGFSVSRHRFAYEIWVAQREYQGVKPTIEGWLQQLQMAAQLKRFLCIFHVSNRASINRCLCTHVRERLQPTSVASVRPPIAGNCVMFNLKIHISSREYWLTFTVLSLRIYLFFIMPWHTHYHRYLYSSCPSPSPLRDPCLCFFPVPVRWFQFYANWFSAIACANRLSEAISHSSSVIMGNIIEHIGFAKGSNLNKYTQSRK